MSRSAAWGWVAHLRDGGTTPVARLVRAPPSRAVRCCRAPSSWSCCAGSTWPAGPRAALLERVLAADPPRRSPPGAAAGRRPGRAGPRPAAGRPRPAAVRRADPAWSPSCSPGELAAPTPRSCRRRGRGCRRPWRDPLPAATATPSSAGRCAATSPPAAGRPAAYRAAGRASAPTPADAGRPLDRPGASATAPRRGELWWRRTTGRGRLPGPARPRRGSSPAELAAPGAGRRPPGHRPRAGHRLLGVRLGRPLPPQRPMAAAAVDLGRRVVAALRPAAPPETAPRRWSPRCCGRGSRPSTGAAARRTRAAPGVGATPRRPGSSPGSSRRRPLPCLRRASALLLPVDRAGSRGDPSARHPGDWDRGCCSRTDGHDPRGGAVSRRVLLHVGTPKTGT